jgi:hypothetical protein
MPLYGGRMPWQHIRIARFGGPEVLSMAEETDVPEPGVGEVRIKVLAAGTGFTDSFIRRGRYPDFKGPLPFIPIASDDSSFVTGIELFVDGGRGQI